MNAAPYPGLRPFKTEESYIFFGREQHTDQLIEKISHTRFIAVLGLSGCGKSSLVQAGMIAGLESGYMATTGSDWQILTMRPGSHPMRMLAKALLDHPDLKLTFPNQQEKSSQISEEEFAYSIASRGPMGLMEVLREASLPRQKNLLFMVDQFEELFRYPEQGSQNEREAFIAMLLNSIEQREVPIYIIVTMRSDYIGDCSQFRGLPEVMDQGQYLTPRLTREQLRTAILGPARVFGGSVEARLVERLFKDMGYDLDQLPVLQHCLMRMWYKAQEKNKDAEEISLTLEDYEHVGGIKDTLSKHADEAFHELNPKQQEIAEVLFRRITERSPDLRDKRHPVPLREIAAVAGVSTADVAPVAERFRRADRCFLTPSPADCKQLQDNTDLDISHESLIRQWKRLNKWVEQEAESAEIYCRLEKTAWRWSQGKAGLWGTPDLEIALTWKEQEKPRAEWVKRYGEHFDLAMKFLDASRRRKFWITCLKVAIPLFILIFAVSFTGWALWERSKKEKARSETEKALIIAEQAKEFAEEQKRKALEQKREAEKAKEEAELHSSRFQEMVNATFGFLLESGENKKFLNWTKETYTIEKLIPALHLMIDLSESSEEEKKSLHQALSVMTPTDRLMLLDKLGTEAAIKARVRDEFYIRQVIIQDTKGKTIESVNGVYSIKLGETVKISVGFTAPDNYEIGVIWTTHYGKIPPISQKTTTNATENFYTAEKSGSDYVIVYIWDKKTGEELQEPINIAVVP